MCYPTLSGDLRLTEAEWQASSSPYDMLQFLDGKVDELSFMRFSVACCRRILHLIPDLRSRKVIDITAAFIENKANAETAGQVFEEWYLAYDEGMVQDHAGGNTHEAVECVAGVGVGNALSVSRACFESVGYAASELLRLAGAPQEKITAVWRSAAAAEKVAQCQILRELFDRVIANVGSRAS